MLKYLDLKELKVETIRSNEEIVTKGISVDIKPGAALVEMSTAAKESVEKLVAELDSAKIYNFHFDIIEELDDEEFETAINVILVAFFRRMTLVMGRPRERRLDVPENLKTQVFCSMSLLKNAINFATRVDCFQVTISNRTLQYILVGDNSHEA